MEDDLHSKGPGRLVTGGAWFLGLMILSGVFWLVLGIQVTRTYGPAAFGVFNTAFSVFDFMWALIFGGLFEGLIQFGASYLTKKDANLARYFAKYVRCLTAMSLILFVVLVFLSFQTSDFMSRVLLISLAVAFLFSGTKESLASILGALHKSKQLSIIQSSGFYAVSVIGIVLIELSMPIDWLPVLIVIAPICQLILCTYFLRPYLRDLISYNIDFLTNKDREQSLWKDIKQFRNILVFGFSISVGKISFMVMKNLDIPILTLFFDYTNVGVYSVADTVSSVLFSMTAFAIPVLSSMSEAWTKQDHVLMKKYVTISVKYPLLIGLPLTIIIFALSEQIVVGIYGVASQGAVMPLQILIIGTFLLMFGRNLSSILIGIGKAKLSGTLMAIAATQYLVSLFILVPIFGLNGGAISLTLTGVTSLILIPFFIKHHLNVDAFSGVQKMLFSSAVLAAILIIVPKTNILFIIAGLVTGLAAFVLILYYTGYINREDLEMLKSARNQQ